MKTSVVGRARAVRAEGVWPRAVTTRTRTTMAHAASGCLWALGYFLCAHPRHSWTWAGGEPRRELSGRNSGAGWRGRSCGQGQSHFLLLPKGLKKKKRKKTSKIWSIQEIMKPVHGSPRVSESSVSWGDDEPIRGGLGSPVED